MTSSPAPTPRAADAAWAAVVPVKPFARAKSRLASLGDQARHDLVAAFAHDTVTALQDSRRVGLVVVVTDELELVRAFAGTGVVAVPEGHGDDLNATLVQGAAESVRRRPDLRPLAVCADLPSLTGEAVDSFLGSVDHLDGPGAASWFVADAAGTGTTSFLATGLEAFDPHFGPGSAAAHVSAGSRDATGHAPLELRRDVDTPEDLAHAVGLGVGERTRWAVTLHRL